jgi:hypothetical protein
MGEETPLSFGELISTIEKNFTNEEKFKSGIGVGVVWNTAWGYFPCQ